MLVMSTSSSNNIRFVILLTNFGSYNSGVNFIVYWPNWKVLIIGSITRGDFVFCWPRYESLLAYLLRHSEVFFYLRAKIECNQRRNEGNKGAQIPGCRKVPRMLQLLCVFLTAYLFPKDLRFEHGGTKLVSCPGRHLTSLRPWVQRKESF